MKTLNTLTHEEFMTLLIAIYGSTLDYSKTIYTNGNIKMIMICNKHGEYKKLPSHLLNGSGCQKCKESQGEKTIRRILEKLEVTFVSQYKIANCKYKLPLPFDFGLLKNEKIVGLIEFQGIQHYAPSRFSSSRTLKQAEEQLILTKRNDEIKKQYCINNNIPLLTIPYWQINEVYDKILDFVTT
jgi:hypothetical protein